MRNVANILVLVSVNTKQRVLLERCAPSAKFVYCEPGEISEQQLASAEVILGNPPIDSLKNAQSLRLLQLGSAGSDSYAAEGVLSQEVFLANATGSYGLAISEYMVSVLLSLNKKLHLYRDQQRKNLWGNLGEVRSIWNSTVLVIGLGDIGSEFAKRVKAFNAKVIGVRRSGLDKPDFVDELYLSDKIDELLPLADTVALCLPQTAQTQGLMNAERIAKMKPGAVLINIGRGSAVDADALCDALDAGKLSGAALDVTVPEPLPAESRLWQTENLIITPHVSGGFSLPETHNRLIGLFAENLTAFIQEKPLKNLVDAKTGYRKL
ncbi:D-2-hydroxyacid dehydrogenase [Oscillospiraceae bacterium LTW-04]|nr:D-2-hydroxyacid dehydrogenase [Oscillospiraceae bacterium MB24-C1]